MQTWKGKREELQQVASRPLGFQNMDQNVLEGFHFETAEEE
jgi:hypothetical protein